MISSFWPLGHKIATFEYCCQRVFLLHIHKPMTVTVWYLQYCNRTLYGRNVLPNFGASRRRYAVTYVCFIGIVIVYLFTPSIPKPIGISTRALRWIRVYIIYTIGDYAPYHSTYHTYPTPPSSDTMLANECALPESHR